MALPGFRLVTRTIMDNGNLYDRDRITSFNEMPPVQLYPRKGINESRDMVFMYKIQYSSSILELTIGKSKIDKITVNIVDLLGKVQKSKDFNLSGSYEMLEIELSDLPSGSYFCNIVSNGNIFGNSKFVIVK